MHANKLPGILLEQRAQTQGDQEDVRRPRGVSAVLQHQPRNDQVIIIIMVIVIFIMIIRFDSEKQMTKLCIYQEQELDVKAHYR